MIITCRDYRDFWPSRYCLKHCNYPRSINFVFNINLKQFPVDNSSFGHLGESITWKYFPRFNRCKQQSMKSLIKSQYALYNTPSFVNLFITEFSSYSINCLCWSLLGTRCIAMHSLYSVMEINKVHRSSISCLRFVNTCIC